MKTNVECYADENIFLAPVTFCLTVLAFFCSCTFLSYGHLELRLAAPTVTNLFVCHFTHWDLNQFFWDGAAFFAIGMFYELNLHGAPRGQMNRSWRLLLHVLVAALVISVLLVLVPGELQTYRGLSGLCSALFTLLLIDLASEARRIGSRGFLNVIRVGGLALFAKICFEAFTGQTVFTSAESYSVVHQAHFYGAMSAICLEGLLRQGAFFFLKK